MPPPLNLQRRRTTALVATHPAPAARPSAFPSIEHCSDHPSPAERLSRVDASRARAQIAGRWAKAVPLPEGARRFRGGIGQKQCTRGKGARPAAAARMPRPCERGSGVAPGAERKPRRGPTLMSTREHACLAPVGAAALRVRPPRVRLCRAGAEGSGRAVRGGQSANPRA
jgi:hypothetical protein